VKKLACRGHLQSFEKISLLNQLARTPARFNACFVKPAWRAVFSRIAIGFSHDETTIGLTSSG
jgi:hypothetical protein